jgi:hypothetical protein
VTVQQVIPESVTVEISELVARLKEPVPPAEPFSAELIGFAASFSRAIFQNRAAAAYPELQALAFWMRKAELVRLQQEFEAALTTDVVKSPRGLVFHLPPANVDTIFVYSWLLAVLAGNRNLIRLSQRATPQTELLCSIFQSVLDSSSGEALRANTVMVRYGHDREITAAFSALCDVRVIWGGDRTVNLIRAIPLPPHAKEITFSDRSSLAVLNGEAYLDLDDAARQHMAAQFFNDVFWFDQMACSSPRLVVWTNPAAAAQAAPLFLQHLAAELERKKFALPAGAWLEKFDFACRAILDMPVRGFSSAPGVVMLDLDTMQGLGREHCGHGLLFQAAVEHLTDLAPFLVRQDQTLAHAGFSGDELRALARRLGGRSIDRMVPLGQALQFHRYWDGYDLLEEFTRRVHIQI